MAHIEEELKLTLSSEHDYSAARTLLMDAGRYVKTRAITNTYFDTPDRALAAMRCCIRLRLSRENDATLCYLTVKSKPELAGGVMKVQELEKEIPVCDYQRLTGEGERAIFAYADQNLQLPACMTSNSDRFTTVTKLAQFESTRDVIEFEGRTLELDHVKFQYPCKGTLYELECETADAAAFLTRLETLFRQNSIGFTHSAAQKLAVALSMKDPNA